MGDREMLFPLDVLLNSGERTRPPKNDPRQLDASECAAGGSDGKARRRRGAAPHKKEQRRQAARQPCNRVRSDFTQVVTSVEGRTVREALNKPSPFGLTFAHKF